MSGECGRCKEVLGDMWESVGGGVGKYEGSARKCWGRCGGCGGFQLHFQINH